MPHIPAKIAGIFSYPEAKYPLKALKPGDAVKLMPEPTNAHDPNAIAIYIPALPVPGAATDAAEEPRFIKAGYVPRTVAASLKGAEFSAVKGNAWDHIVIEVVHGKA